MISLAELRAAPAAVFPARRRGAQASLRERTLGAGLVDAGLASLATFCCGFYASRFLPPEVLGEYALAFRAFVLAAVLPAQLFFQPAEIAAVRVDGARRLSLLPQTLRRSLPIALTAALLAALWPLAGRDGFGSPTVMAINITVVVCTLLSPVQDHVRKMLHIGNSSWSAAIVSAVQLTVVMVVLGFGLSMKGRVHAAWLPFGALALANLLSLAAGMAFGARMRPGPAATLDVGTGDLLRSGRWLFIVGMLSPATAFVGSTIVLRIAGQAALGYAEAARVIAQPLLVLAVGLNSVLGPRSVEAAQKQQALRARRISLLFNGAVVVGGLAYLALVGFAWRGNPAALALPAAFHIPGLVALTVLAHLANGVAFPQRNELLGAGKERFLTRVEVIGNVIRLAAAFAAVWISSLSLPAGLLILGTLRYWAFRRKVATLYPVPPVRPAASAPSLRGLQPVQ